MATDLVREPLLAGQSFRMRRQLRDLQVGLLSNARLVESAKTTCLHSGAVIVLTLHRIVPDADLHLCRSPRGMVLRESLFERLLAYLRKDTAVMEPMEARSAPRTKLPRILITFDDGWFDNFTVARRHLDAMDMRATFFIPTALVGLTEPFWPERVLELLEDARRWNLWDSLNESLQTLPGQDAKHPTFSNSNDTESCLTWFKQFPLSVLRPWLDDSRKRLEHEVGGRDQRKEADATERIMSWEQIRTLSQADHRIGSHGRSHEILSNIPYVQLKQEMEGSLDDLKENVNQADHWVSYPNGSWSESVTIASSRAGYCFGFTNTPGRWRPGASPYLIPRLNIWDGTITDANGKFSPDHLEKALFWTTRHA